MILDVGRPEIGYRVLDEIDFIEGADKKVDEELGQGL